MVGVEEGDAPGALAGDTCCRSRVLVKRAVGIAEVEHVALCDGLVVVAGVQVRDVDVPVAVEVDVCEVDAHACAGIVTDAGHGGRDLCKRAVAVIHEDEVVVVGRGVVGIDDVEVGPEVMIEVACHEGQCWPVPVGPANGETCCDRGIGKGAVALVMVERVGVGDVGSEVEDHVAYIEIHAAVAVVVHPAEGEGSVAGQGAERGRGEIVNTGSGSNIHEKWLAEDRPTAVLHPEVLQQNVGWSIPFELPMCHTDVDVHIAVVVIVGVGRVCQFQVGVNGRQQGELVREGAVALIAIQAAIVALAVDHEKVWPAVVVVVEPNEPAAVICEAAVKV